MKLRSALFVVILGSGTVLAAAPRPGFRVRVVNTSPDVIREVYVTPAGSHTWGKNLLGTRPPLEPGQKITVRVLDSCGTYNVRLVADDHTEYLEDELAFCEDDDVLTVGRGALKRTKARRAPRQE